MQPIRVYSQGLNLLAEIDTYQSLQFTPKFYDVGAFELHINQYIEGSEHFQKGNLIVLDKDESKAMIIRHREIALDESGKASENWKITGVALKGVLDQRVTIPPNDTAYDRKSGDAETVMKHYVERHVVNPDDPARKIDFIEIAPNQNRGEHVEWESRFKNVAEELTEISKLGNLGWVLYADMERGKWIFDVAEPRDLTADNKAGNPPVFFSPDFQTVKNQTFVDSDSNYKNVGYVGGQGEGTERKIVTIGESKGIERRETFVDARDVGTTEDDEEELSEEEIEQQLIERGNEKMREFETNFYLEAQILTPVINDRQNEFAMSTPFEYEKDFRLGDIVQVFNKKWNITMDAPITEFKEIHEPSGFVLEATFGEAQPTLISKIKREFDDLKGIEKQELPVHVAAEKMREANRYTDEGLSKEEKERIQQAQNNLEASKEYASEQAYQAEQDAIEYVEDYAEKKVVKSVTPPQDTTVLWFDTSRTPNVIRAHDGNDWEKATPTEAGELVYSDGTPVEDLKPNEAGSDKTSNNTSKDTENVGGRPSDSIEDKEGSQNKADKAEDNAKKYVDDNLTNYVEAVVYDSEIADIQAQIDHQIQSHFYDHEPTLNNLPASEWTDEKTRAQHVGDLFFNSDTGYSYRFAKQSGNFKWVQVRDEGISKALQDASDAQDTADSKRRVFVAQPIPPYDKGDLWDDGGKIKRSIADKTKSATFSDSDWVLIGDVTGENTANDTEHVGGRPASDIEDKQGAQDKADNAESNANGYTDEGLKSKADSDVVQRIDGTVSELQGTAANLLQSVSNHSDELNAHGGRITTVEGDLDTVEGNLSVAIEDLSSLDGVVSQQRTDIDANSEALRFKASQDELDTVSGNVSDLSGELNVLAGEVSLKAERSTVEGLRTDFENLEVGGRNLLRNSDFSDRDREWVLYRNENAEFIDGAVILSNSDSGEDAVYQPIAKSSYNITDETITTVSVWVKGNGILRVRWGRSNTHIIDDYQVNSDEFIKVTGTKESKGNSNLIFYLIDAGELTFDRVQLEKGNKATDWTLAPEDYEAEFQSVNQKVAELNVSVDGITSSVSDISQDVTDHGTRISSAESTIEQHADLIRSKAEKDEFDSVTGGLSSSVSSITQKIGVIEFEVSLLEGVGDAMSEAQSSIKQLSNEIELKVDKDGIVSQLNINPEGIRLKGDLIHLDGTSLIDRGIIDTAHIANGAISRAKLGTAVVDTAQIANAAITNAKVKSINADKVNATSLSAISANLGTVTAGRLLSDNNNMDLNLNTGALTMRNADFTLGNGANINFTDVGNRITYRHYDSSAGFSRSSGLGVGLVRGGTYPFAYLGTNGSSELDTLSQYFTGFMAMTSAYIADGAANSVTGRRFEMRNKAVNWDKGIEYDFNGTPTIRPFSHADYDIGTTNYRFRRLYVNDILTYPTLFITNTGANRGFAIDTDYTDGHNPAIYGQYPADNYYNLGRDWGPFSYGYITSVYADYLRGSLQGNSARKYKKNEGKMNLADSLEFIRNAEIVTFDWIRDENLKINKDNPQTIYDRQVGFILDDLEMENDWLVRSDEETIKKDNIIFMHQQVIQDNLKRLDGHDDELSWLKTENQLLKNEIKILQNKVNQLEEKIA